MERTLKIFCSGAEQDKLSDEIPVIERYTGFLLILSMFCMTDFICSSNPGFLEAGGRQLRIKN